MFSRNNTHQLDTSLFDPEHDLDLVILFGNARTETELKAAAGLSRSRMRARRAELKALVRSSGASRHPDRQQIRNV
jgi:hypothetical protein